MSLGPIDLSPILCGYVADRYNWRTNFWILTAFTAVNLILVVLFVSEIQHERPSIYDTDNMTAEPSQAEAATIPADEGQESPSLNGKAATVRAEYPEQEKPLSYWQGLKPYSGLRMKGSLWKHVARLFACATACSVGIETKCIFYASGRA